MEISVWVIVAVITRWLNYCGLAALVAAPTLLIISQHNHLLPLRAYACIAALVAVLASVSYFFIQVGALSESGWQGMFDPMMLNILWQSGHGDGLIYRLASITLLFSVCVLPVSERYKGIKAIAYGIALLVLALSFSTTGHTASLAVWVQVVIGLHVVVALWWIGSLLPLAQACQRLDTNALYQFMHNFGRVATILVVTLCVLGVTLALQLISSIGLLFTSAYGQILLLKVFLVTAILLLAALHKWQRVPALLQQEYTRKQAHERLKVSIKWELFVGLVVLLLTAVLTSAIGPE